jgi:hypothetical protein
MNTKQSLMIATIALMALCFVMSSNATSSETKSAVEASAAPAPTPKKNDFPVGRDTGTVKPLAGLKGTIKFSATGQQLHTLSCEDLEVMVNKGPETVATVKASGKFLSGRCSFNISGLPANVALALLVPKPDWVPNKCSQLDFANQAIAVPPIKPGVTKPVVVNIKTLKCANP